MNKAIVNSVQGNITKELINNGIGVGVGDTSSSIAIQYILPSNSIVIYCMAKTSHYLGCIYYY